MSTWSEILPELQQSQDADGVPNFDGVRRKYLAHHHQLTGRNTVLYVTKCTSDDPVPGTITTITEADMLGFMEVVHDLPNSPLDLILHSPGGELDATGSIVSFLRARFNHMRVIVPQFAMSAATMIACAAEEIVMCDHSSLGPIDPQMYVPTALGGRMVAAQDVLEQFKMAQQDCQDPAKQAAWYPILSQYGPDLLVHCQHAMDLSRELVGQWLEAYMYNNVDDASSQAQSIAEWLSNRTHFKSHSRRLDWKTLSDKGLKVYRMEDNPVEYRNLMSLYHAVQHGFEGTAAVKLFANHMGNTLAKSQSSAADG